MYPSHHGTSHATLLLIVILLIRISCHAAKEVFFITHENLKITLQPDVEKNTSSPLECQILHLQKEGEEKEKYYMLNTIQFADGLFACQMFSVNLNPKTHNNETFQPDVNSTVYITDQLESPESCQKWKDLGFNTNGMY